ncbi:MAG: hypothetical protein E7451_06345 [Ruminococcaceae bacterium]|nr:hypothetical protein [Oscillospiraceae bacterium]
MKRTICLLLALLLCLSLAPAASADVIFEPGDSFYWDHRGECQYHSRSYYADGPDNVAVIYRSPLSSAVVERVKNGLELWISYIWEDAEGFLWGYSENYEEGWAGWVPMDYLLLKYDSISFQEEFAARITAEEGTLPSAAEGRFHFWSYPGSDTLQADMPVEPDYLPEYYETFTDDAGRRWGHIGYHMGLRNVWVCLDDPTADYRTLYAEQEPQQVTHPVKQENAPLPQIKPQGISLNGILAAVCAVSILSIGWLWMTRKKK